MNEIDGLGLIDPKCYAERGYPHDAWTALRRKYPQYDTTDMLPDPATLIAIHVERLTSWCPDPTAFANL